MSNQKVTRERIIEAATQILAEDSYSRFSIERISERAGISRRSFFNYFKSKDELLAEVLKTLRALHDRAMQAWSAELPDGLTVEARIVEIFRRIIDIISQPGWRGSAFIRLAGELSDFEGHPIQALVAEAKRDQEKWFETELRKGDFVSPALLAAQLTIVMTGLFQLQLVHRSPRLGQAVLAMIPPLLAAGRSQPG